VVVEFEPDQLRWHLVRGMTRPYLRLDRLCGLTLLRSQRPRPYMRLWPSAPAPEDAIRQTRGGRARQRRSPWEDLLSTLVVQLQSDPVPPAFREVVLPALRSGPL